PAARAGVPAPRRRRAAVPAPAPTPPGPAATAAAVTPLGPPAAPASAAPNVPAPAPAVAPAANGHPTAADDAAPAGRRADALAPGEPTQADPSSFLIGVAVDVAAAPARSGADEAAAAAAVAPGPGQPAALVPAAVQSLEQGVQTFLVQLDRLGDRLRDDPAGGSQTLIWVGVGVGAVLGAGLAGQYLRRRAARAGLEPLRLTDGTWS